MKSSSKVYPFTQEEIAAIMQQYRPVLYPAGPFAVGANARRGDSGIRELFKGDRIPLRPLFTFRPGGGYRSFLGRGKHGRSMCHHAIKYRIYDYKGAQKHRYGYRLQTFQRCEWRGVPLIADTHKPKQLAFEV